MQFAIGIDIEENKRFEGKSLAFLKKIFTQKELDYCLKNKNSAPHFCARFCAKEAVVKALSDFDIKDVYYRDIEIVQNENKSLRAVILKHPEIEAKVSISHSKSSSCANALLVKSCKAL